MAKAAVTLTNGTEVTIEGTPEEVRQLLEFYGTGSRLGAPAKQRKAARSSRTKSQLKPAKSSEEAESAVDVSEIVNIVKDCDEADAIERHILDRTSQVDRTLLPLYVVHEHLDNAHPLSSGTIAKVLADLGVPLAGPNVSRTLSGIASRYVMGDTVRKKGKVTKYKLSRRGVQYMQRVVSGKSDEE
jgi:hypothetical protein